MCLSFVFLNKLILCLSLKFQVINLYGNKSLNDVDADVGLSKVEQYTRNVDYHMHNPE